MLFAPVAFRRHRLAGPAIEAGTSVALPALTQTAFFLLAASIDAAAAVCTRPPTWSAPSFAAHRCPLSLFE
jgi:hypothetical protein